MQVSREPHRRLAQMLRVFQGGSRIMDGAWSDDGEEPVIAVEDDVLDGMAAPRDKFHAGLVDRQFCGQSRRRKQRQRTADAEILVGGVGHEKRGTGDVGAAAPRGSNDVIKGSG